MTTATTDARAASAPWHVWVVGLIGLAWNGFGAYDYTMTQLQGDAYLRAAGMTGSMPPAARSVKLRGFEAPVECVSFSQWHEARP